MTLFLYEREIITGSFERGILCAENLSKATDSALFAAGEDDDYIKSIKVTALDTDTLELNDLAYDLIYGANFDTEFDNEDEDEITD